MTEKTLKLKNNLTEGPLLPGIIRFSLPLAATGTIQILFNVADLAVVGKFAGNADMAAVGATTALINLFVNLFVGMAVGANVITARYIGAKDRDGVHRAVHTSMLSAVIFGVITAILGIATSVPMLKIMNTPESVLPLATVYMKIYMAGSVGNLVLNFGSAILRASGDSKRPLIFLTISGCVNVGLNLIFVIVFGMGVAGVAIATITSQALSAVMITVTLIREKSDIRLSLGKLRIYKKEFLGIVRIGLPSGLQGSLFSISNVVIQSSLNGFGEQVMSGISAGQSLEGFVYCGMNSVYQTSITFVSQNYGAENYKRIRKVTFFCLVYVTLIGMLLSGIEIGFGRQILRFYTNDPVVIEVAYARLFAIDIVYFLLGIQDVLSGFMRGIDHALFPTTVCIVGIIGFRLIWIYFVFPVLHTVGWINVSYPLSWIVCLLIIIPASVVFMKKLPKTDRSELLQSQRETDLSAK